MSIKVIEYESLRNEIRSHMNWVQTITLVTFLSIISLFTLAIITNCNILGLLSLPVLYIGLSLVNEQMQEVKSKGDYIRINHEPGEIGWEHLMMKKRITRDLDHEKSLILEAAGDSRTIVLSSYLLAMLGMTIYLSSVGLSLIYQGALVMIVPILMRYLPFSPIKRILEVYTGGD